MKLRHLFYNSILIIFFSIISYTGYTQCKDFSVNTCKPSLYPFIHDGIYSAHVLSTGESAELFRTFFAGQNYRMLICKPENIPSIQIVVMDTKRNVLYKKDLNMEANIWDFKLESSQQLIVALNIEKQEQTESGCVAILIGFKENF